MSSIDKTKMEYRKSFYKAYHSELAPILASFENKRLDYLSQLKFLEFALVFLAVFFAFLFFSMASEPAWALIGCAVCIVVAIVLLFVYNSKFVKDMKSYCLRPILKIFGNITWSKEGFQDSELNNCGLFSVYNRRSDDDCFEGEYKGVKFGMNELTLGYESGSGKNRHYHQVFNGVVVKFSSNKRIGAKTIVASKFDNNTSVGSFWAGMITILIICLQLLVSMKFSPVSFVICGIVILVSLVIWVYKIIRPDEHAMHEIKLEDPLFGRQYKVYSEDDIEARYLITTAFMERFINLKESFGGKGAKCSFYDDQIVFAISTRENLFEIGNLFKSTNDTKQMEKFFEEFSSVLLLVDYFKIDQKLGL